MYKKLIRKSLLTTAIAASIGLTACGGGGGGASGVSDVDVSGTAAKGIINKGVVLAEELNESQEVIAIVGNATTAVDGSYSMTLSSAYQGGPVQITVSMDADTEMKCDVPAGCGTRTDTIVDTDSIIDFAEWYKPASLTMTALLPESVANAQVSVNVTPLHPYGSRKS